MKRFWVVVLLIFSLIGTLTACGTTGDCDVCGYEERLKTVSVPFYGEMDLCNDCAKEAKDMRYR